MRKAKIFSVFTAIFLLLSTMCGSLSAYAAFTPKFALQSEGVYMVNLDTDIVIVSKNPDKKLYPASTTKIMTCLVALANITDFDAIVEFPTVCTDEFTYDKSQSVYNPNYAGASSGGILPGQSNLTYWDVIYSTMLPSGCDSANVLAYNVGGGSIENFISMMNSMAKKIGCQNTHFSNAHGLFDEDNYTTARDMYLITKYAMDNYPTFMKICGTNSYDMPSNSLNPDGYTKNTTNVLQNPNSEYYYEGVQGIKTGSIDYYIHKKADGSWDMENQEPGTRALVTTCQRNGYTYMIVTLGAPYWDEEGNKSDYNFTDHIALYDWAFEDFEYKPVIKENELITQVKVDKGKDTDTVNIVATEDFYTLLPKSLDPSTIQRILPEIPELEAPITRGEVVGKMKLKLNDEIIARMELVTNDDIELDMNAYYKEKLRNIVSTAQFKAIIITLIGLVAVYIAANLIYKSHKKKMLEASRRKIQMAPPNGQKRKPASSATRRPTNGNNRPQNRR